MTPLSVCLVTTDFSLFVEKSGARPLLPGSGAPGRVPAPGQRCTSCCPRAPPPQHLGPRPRLPALLIFREKVCITDCGSIWSLGAQQPPAWPCGRGSPRPCQTPDPALLRLSPASLQPGPSGVLLPGPWAQERLMGPELGRFSCCSALPRAAFGRHQGSLPTWMEPVNRVLLQPSRDRQHPGGVLVLPDTAPSPFGVTVTREQIFPNRKPHPLSTGPGRGRRDTGPGVRGGGRERQLWPGQ